MIRIATQEDLDLVVSLASKFAQESPYSALVSPDKVRSIVEGILSADQSQKIILLYEDKGMLAGMLTPFLFGDKIVATELAWWVEPEHRKSQVGLQLLEAFEYWAKKTGANLITMISIDDAVGEFYQKKGYSLFERAYMKEIP